MVSLIQDMENPRESILQLPAKKRLDVIVNHPTPLKLVRSMPTTDLLLTIRDLGGESALELVEMMHPTQVQELMDLEIWSRDDLNLKAASHYFSLLFAANRDTAVAQIHNLDIELIGLLLRTTATIYDVTLNEEPENFSDVYSLSPDGRFIVCFSDDKEIEGLAHSLRDFLEDLYGRDMTFALRLLESVRYELSSTLLEESLRFRNNRLLDYGILPPIERLSYFSRVSKDDIKKIVTGNFGAPRYGENLLPTIFHERKIESSHIFLRAALEKDGGILDFWPSFMHAVANMHASLSGDFGDREEILKTASYVKFLLDLGLFQCGQGKTEQCAFHNYSMKFLIRVGRTALLNLQKRINSLPPLINDVLGKNFCHLDSPLREVALALTLAEPCYYEGLISSKKLVVRYFSNLTELQGVVAALNEIIFRGEFVALGLGITKGDLSNRTHLSQANLFARTLINQYQKNSDPLADINESATRSFILLGVFHEDFLAFADSFTNKAAHALIAKSNRDEGVMTSAHNFKNAVLSQISQNFLAATA
jgi:hypothetical protein